MDEIRCKKIKTSRPERVKSLFIFFNNPGKVRPLEFSLNMNISAGAYSGGRRRDEDSKG
jgi:hypothetical protein